MSVSSILMAAYAFATQERYQEAEGLMQSCPESLQTIQGQDLLARIRVAQGRKDEARQLWHKIIEIDPTNDKAKSAVDALDAPKTLLMNKSSHYIGTACTIILTAMLAWMLGGALNPKVVYRDPTIIYETNTVDRIVTNEIVRVDTKLVEVPVEKIIERVVTNTVEKLVEVPMVTVVTSIVEHVEQETTRIGQNQEDRVLNNPKYVVLIGDQVGKLQQRYCFRMKDFRDLNPGVDENHIYPGQVIVIPGVFAKDGILK